MADQNRISVRRCVAGEEIALSVLGHATFYEAFAEFVPVADLVAHCTRQHSVEKYAAYLADPATAVFVADVPFSGPGAGDPGRRSAPVGYVVLTTPDLPLADISATDAEIKRVYVLARFQGRAIGATLMRAAEREAAARGKRRLLLGVNAQNAPAISFYEKLGYRKVGERRFQVGGQTYDDWVMGKRVEGVSGWNDEQV